MRTLCLWLFLIGYTAHGQWRNANWMFSHWLQFSAGPVQVMPGGNYGYGNPTALSDTAGNVLVYSGGNAFTDAPRCADGSMMPLPASYENALQPHTQPWLFLPWPMDPTRIAAFRRRPDSGQNFYDWTSLEMWEIDLTANNGQGAVVGNAVQLGDSIAHKLTAIPHANGQDYWIITHTRATDEFLAFRLRPSGVNPVPVVSHAGSVLPEDASNPMIHGPLVPSFQGDRLVSVSFCANPSLLDSSITELFNFNNATGQVTFNMGISYTNNYMGAGGAEFSPDGSKLYVVPLQIDPTFKFQLEQYDLSVGDPSGILSSRALVAEFLPTPTVVISSDPIEAAPDGKIYIGIGEGPINLRVIEHPDSAGSACGINLAGPFLPFGGGPIMMPHFCKRYHDSQLSVGLHGTEPSEERMALWPVPVQQRLNVSVPGAGRITVLDQLGREVQGQRVTERGTQHVNTGTLAPGLYTLCFVSESGVRSASVFVKE